MSNSLTPNALRPTACAFHADVPVTFSPHTFPWGHWFLLSIFQPWEKRGHWLTEEQCERRPRGPSLTHTDRSTLLPLTVVENSLSGKNLINPAHCATTCYMVPQRCSTHRHDCQPSLTLCLLTVWISLKFIFSMLTCINNFWFADERVFAFS